MIRTMRLALVTTLIAAVLTVVPAPTIVWADELDTVTYSPVAVKLEVPETALARGLIRELDQHEDPQGGVAESGDVITGDVPPERPVDTPVRGGFLRIADESLDPFTAIGVTAERVPPHPVAIRVKDQGSWSEWAELHIDTGHAPETPAERAHVRPGYTSDPVLTMDATAYEIQAPAAAGAVQVHLVTKVGRTAQIQTNEDEAGAAQSVPVHGRSAWGARAPSGNPGYGSNLHFSVIHHVGQSTFNDGYASSQVPGILRSIQAFHMDARGWDDIGYNFVVDRFGRIWEARAGGLKAAVVGAHAYGFNTGSVGVLLLGDYTGSTPSSAAVNAAADLISWKFGLFNTKPSGSYTYTTRIATRFGPAGTKVSVNRVSGHRDVVSTACPANAYSSLPTIRTRVTNRYPLYFREHDLSVPKALYQDYLGRAGVEWEHRDWARRLIGRSQQQISYRFARSAEYINTYVSGLYRTALDREGSASEISSWRKKILNGLLPSRVAVDFYASGEFFSKAGNAAGYVDQLYRRILGRPSDSGRSSWIRRVNSGESRIRITRDMYGSLESRHKRVHGLYDHFLNRRADSTGLRTWSKRLENGDDLALATFLTGSVEYSGRANKRYPDAEAAGDAPGLLDWLLPGS